MDEANSFAGHMECDAHGVPAGESLSPTPLECCQPFGQCVGEPHAEARCPATPSDLVPRQPHRETKPCVPPKGGLSRDPIAARQLLAESLSGAAGGDPLGSGQFPYDNLAEGARSEPHQQAIPHLRTVPHVPADPIADDHSVAVPLRTCVAGGPIPSDQAATGNPSGCAAGDDIGSGQTAHEVQIRSAAPDPVLGDQAARVAHLNDVAESPIPAGHLSPDAQADAAGGSPHPLPRATIHLEPRADVPEAAELLAAQVRTLHRRAQFLSMQRIAVGNRLAAFVRTDFLGFSTRLPEAERAKALKAAQRALSQARKGERVDGMTATEAEALRALITASDLSIEPVKILERTCVRAMEKLARGLPGYAFVKATRGFGDVSFARIIGETGPLHLYANPAKVWKRLGLAVIAGERQRKHSNVELAVAHGYNPRRRSVSWVAFEALMKAQGLGESAGPYRRLYDYAKENYSAREGWNKIHVHRAASRYAEKRLIRDLWRAWRDDIRGQKSAEPQVGDAPDPIPSGHASCAIPTEGAAGVPIADRRGASATRRELAVGDPIGSGQAGADTHVPFAASDLIPAGRSRRANRSASAGGDLAAAPTA